MHIIFLLFITAVAYCVVNAAIAAVQLVHTTQLARFAAFFKHVCAQSAFTVFAALVLQALFLVYSCRLEAIFYKFFGGGALAGCTILSTDSFLVHAQLGVLALFYVGAVVLQYFLLHAAYELEDDTVLRIVVISNLCACAAKYATLLAVL